jgi:glycerol-3-phosphate dehydrogenase
VRLVRGSHIVTRKLYDHDRCYFFQGTDGRIIFAIPYEQDFTLIGTTDQDHQGAPGDVVCTDAERDYLLDFASRYFAEPVTAEDVVWTYSGVRPLYNDGAKSATAATRDYVLSLDTNGAPLLNVFGGKITTYRELAERGLHRLKHIFPNMGGDWTHGAPLPGGEIPNADYETFANGLREAYPWMPRALVQHYGRLYGARTKDVVASAASLAELGQHFGGNLYEAEARYLVAREWAQTAEDVLWRRTKHRLHLTEAEQAAFADWFAGSHLAAA